MKHVRDILASKGHTVYTGDAATSVLDATREMNRHHIGSLVVTNDSGQVVGIFSERDVLRRVVVEQRNPAETPISEVMTRQVICVKPESPTDEVRSIVAQHRVRHLPVVNESGELVGLISIGDLNKATANDLEVHITYLEEYIYGRA